MVFCTNCGSENPEGARFCYKCGGEIQSTNYVEKKEIRSYNSKKKSNKTLMNLAIIIAAVIIIYIVIQAVMALFFLSSFENIFSHFP